MDSETISNAHVPLSKMFGYVIRQRLLTQGRAQPNVTPSHFEEAPNELATEIVAKAQGGR